MEKKRTKVPDSATKLKLRITVDAHGGEGGHREFAATRDIIGQHHWWTEMKQNTREFTQSFIHSIVSQNGERVSRPLGSTLHCERPNKVVHLDFRYMKPE